MKRDPHIDLCKKCQHQHRQILKATLAMVVRDTFLMNLFDENDVMYNLFLQKQQNSLLAGLRATNELLATMQDHNEEKAKEIGVERDDDNETKVGFLPVCY